MFYKESEAEYGEFERYWMSAFRYAGRGSMGLVMRNRVISRNDLWGAVEISLDS